MAMASTTSTPSSSHGNGFNHIRRSYILLSGSMSSVDGLMNSNFLRTLLPCSSSMATISASAPFKLFLVEHVIREQNIMAANEIIELFCELVVASLSIIAKQRECPTDLKKGISSFIFSTPRCADIPELLQVRTIFEKKYGKEFVNAATELRPDCGVNRMMIDKLSVRTPTGEVKLKLMKEIAKEYQIAWDHTETENELLKPPEDLIEGPRRFVSATSMPVKPVSSQGGEANQSSNRLFNDRRHTMNFEDSATAAKVAANSAERAVAAAQAAAYLANRDIRQVSQTSFSHDTDGLSNVLSNKKYMLGNSSNLSMSDEPPVNSQDRMHYREPPERSYDCHSYDSSRSSSLSMLSDLPLNSQDGVDAPVDSQDSVHHHEPMGTVKSHSSSRRSRPDLTVNSQDRVDHPDFPGRTYESHSTDRSRFLGNEDCKRIHRRHSYNTPAVHSDIKFDESDGLDSDCDEDIEMETPPCEIHPPPHRPPPPVPPSHRRNSLPRVHPKLPDYEDLSTRFEALKCRKY